MPHSFTHNLNSTEAGKAPFAHSTHATATSAYVDITLALLTNREKYYSPLCIGQEACFLMMRGIWEYVELLLHYLTFSCVQLCDTS